MKDKRVVDRCPECKGIVFKYIDKNGKPMKACLICGKELIIRESEMHEFKKFAEEFNH
jgi:uncharacterized Zn finger protein (UPF0148 family)